MAHGFGYAEEQKADAHAGGEQHREPADIAVIRRRLRTTKPDAAIWRHDQQQAEDHEDIGRPQKEPVKSLGHCREQPTEHVACLIGQCERVEYEQHHRETRDEEDRVMDIKAERTDPRYDIVLTDLVIGLDEIHVPLGRGYPLHVYFAVGHARRPPFFLANQVSHVESEVRAYTRPCGLDPDAARCSLTVRVTANKRPRFPQFFTERVSFRHTLFALLPRSVTTALTGWQAIAPIF